MESNLQLTDEERQMVLLALAKLAIEYPGWDNPYALQGIVTKLKGAVIYANLKAMHAPPPKPTRRLKI